MLKTKIVVKNKKIGEIFRMVSNDGKNRRFKENIDNLSGFK